MDPDKGAEACRGQRCASCELEASLVYLTSSNFQARQGSAVRPCLQKGETNEIKA